MKPSRITAALGIVLIALGIWALIVSGNVGSLVPTVIGGALVFLAFKRGRVATLVFGHTCIVTGAYLVTGVYCYCLIHSQPWPISSDVPFSGGSSVWGAACARSSTASVAA